MDIMTMCLIAVALFLIVCTGLHITFRIIKRSNVQKRLVGISASSVTVGLFHPYCNDGGGGERVLWTAVRMLQKKYPNSHCIIYTGDKIVTKMDILKTVRSRFDIIIEENIHFVFLKSRFLIEAKRYPYFTLLFQSLGSMLLGLEALCKFAPDIYFDSMGYAFTYPIFRYIGNCLIGCYVHYPTISTDMLGAVSDRRETVNNKRFISRSKYLSFGKVIYYKIFARMYGIVGRQADVVMVNSSWTKEHIASLWKNHSCIQLVYPPCDTMEFQKLTLPDSEKNLRLLSIAQFRPEKNHALQIKAFHEYITKFKPKNSEVLKLVLAGGCRSNEDHERVSDLRKLCKSLDLSENVIFLLNLSFKDLLAEMENAGVALHSMWNEHFGISVVECMSAGQLIIAHNSGGPKMDIVITEGEKQNGFLADDVETYASAMQDIFKMPEEQQLTIRKNARKASERFSVENFEKSFDSAFRTLYNLCE